MLTLYSSDLNILGDTLHIFTPGLVLLKVEWAESWNRCGVSSDTKCWTGMIFLPSTQIAKSTFRDPKATEWIERSLALGKQAESGPWQAAPSSVCAQELDLILVSAHHQLTLRCHTGMMRLLLEWPKTSGILTVFQTACRLTPLWESWRS